MRPRLKAAENSNRLCRAKNPARASMRPRLKAAENVAVCRPARFGLATLQ